jgi:hypothetical protein
MACVLTGTRREARERQDVIRRLEDGYSEVLRAWEGETVAIFATGPSLTQEDVDRCRGFKTIAVNDAYRLAPWADVLYFADYQWWNWHKDREGFRSFPGVKVTIEQSAGLAPFDETMHALRNLNNVGGRDGLSLDPRGIKTGKNSGYQALNLAVLLGAKRIYLLGFDMKFKAGKAHFFGAHPAPNFESEFREFAKRFSTLENPLKEIGVEVLNATPGSLIEAFPKVSLESLVTDKTPATV